MVPGKVYNGVVICIDYKKKYADPILPPVARLLLNGDYSGDSIVTKRLGKGRYNYTFTVPNDTPDGTLVHIEHLAIVEAPIEPIVPIVITQVEKFGIVKDDRNIATFDDLCVVNNALKVISLDAGIPHTQDLTPRMMS